MLEIIVLIISIIIILIVIKYKNTYNDIEGFQDENKQNEYTLDSCPPNFKSYYDNNGNIMCCNGEIIANKCISDQVCSLTSNEQDSCISMIQDIYKEKSKEYCTSSLSNYFEKGDIKGCTNGPLNTSMSGPKKHDQPTCYIYSDREKNINSANSCYNQKLLDNTPCFGNNCTKSIIQLIEGKPALIGVSFIDNSGIHRTAYTRESLENFLNATQHGWKKGGIDLDKNIQVAEVAKAYFIDRTLQQSDIQI
jgi:hypothetical protein